ncbi:MAG: energy transducer TonB [Emticicia sp.]
MKKLFIILSLSLFGGQVAVAQSAEPVYEKTDVTAEYQGGMTEMFNFIGKNIKYPKPAVDAKVTGKVFVKIIIEKDGTISSPEIVQGIGFGCDKEVMRVVGLMPKWTAGQIGGKAVRSSMVLPVMFAMNNKK